MMFFWSGCRWGSQNVHFTEQQWIIITWATCNCKYQALSWCTFTLYSMVISLKEIDIDLVLLMWVGASWTLDYSTEQHEKNVCAMYDICGSRTDGKVLNCPYPTPAVTVMFSLAPLYATFSPWQMTWQETLIVGISRFFELWFFRRMNFKIDL